MKRALAWFCVCLVLAGPGARSALADPVSAEAFADELDRAENAWVFGGFDEVISILEPLVLPTAPEATPRQLERAYTRLGASAYYVERMELAEAAFLALLRGDPSYELDPFLFPNTVIDFFERVREAHRDELGTVEEPAVGEVVWVERHVQRQPLAVSMLPLGVGFFAAERPVEGAVWASTQTGLAVTSVGFWLLNEGARIEGGSLVGPQGGLPRTDIVVRRQRVHVATGALFLGAALANAIHGAAMHQRFERVEFRTLPGPPEELTRAPARPRRWVVSVFPIVAPARTSQHW